MTMIADIQVLDDWINTPVGIFRRAGARWEVGATIQRPDRIPGWAWAAALLLLPCSGGLSLLWLLCRESDGQLTTIRVSDSVQQYVTMLYTRDHAEYQTAMRAIAWACVAQDRLMLP